MPQLEHIEAIEKRLWSAADTLRANSNFAANEFFMPVMGLIFLRHAYSRYLAVKDAVLASLPSRGGKTRPPTKEDFSAKGAVFLRPEAQFDHLVALPDSANRAAAVIHAMESIEADYESLKGVLPKEEYNELDNDILGQLLRQLNPDELQKMSGDVFGRIYDYFLAQFTLKTTAFEDEIAMPHSLEKLIVDVLEPTHGIVFDPICHTGGCFARTAEFLNSRNLDVASWVTFFGTDKTSPTIKLAKMNMAVHGIEADIKSATIYEDPQEMTGKADYVLAFPPFNVDEIDADKIKNDPRLPFGLPGVNNKGKVSNGNYVWISYFYSYLNATGRAGFVMAAGAESAGRADALVRRKLVETGDVDIMVSIRSNFFYTRSVPCVLWFLNRAKKTETMKDTVLMLDARNVYRKVTRKINDFSPEQEQNLLAIVWLYRGETGRYRQLLADYRANGQNEAADWLEERFPDATYRDVEGLVKAVSRAEIAANDWSLTPGRYVGVAETGDGGEDFAEKFAALHAELRTLNAEAAALARKIDANFKELMG
jgi:type I restriction enzyme M protein